MSNTVYLCRDDEQTLFDIGSHREGFQQYFEARTGALPEFGRMWRDLYALMVFMEPWDLEPQDAATYAKQLADRIVRWADGQPVRVVVNGFDRTEGYDVVGDRWVEDQQFELGERVGLPSDQTGVIVERFDHEFRDPEFGIRLDSTGARKIFGASRLHKLSLLEQLPPID